MSFKYLFFFFLLMVLSCVTFNARGLMDMRKFEKVGKNVKGKTLLHYKKRTGMKM